MCPPINDIVAFDGLLNQFENKDYVIIPTLDILYLLILTSIAIAIRINGLSHLTFFYQILPYNFKSFAYNLKSILGITKLFDSRKNHKKDGVWYD